MQQRLRNDDKKALGEVYLSYKVAFVNYAIRYNIDNDTILDIYQEAIIAMHQNFVIKQTVLQNSTVKTYLFGIGKHKIYDYLKANKKMFAITDASSNEITEINIEDTAPTERQQLLALNFEKLGESCKEILKLFYYRGFSIKDIVFHTHYKDENTVKSHKSRCLKKLTTFIHEN
ncbi:hypothetical protein IMCC3317_10120 [Kordia antarctica]|uniref:RNA polymerase sigma-70 region 2 domain-containing protein n=1 Tax=Kordia antarctica TaxID=1218801 RepID=A0A7L4ZHG5_9FLAO|nr:sigma-70 family RNA polymerase sigma factor [Kordia antarctica]QHI35666.1 hypothetical protein IMCC3317_10120 [Kordia antarctica]